MSQRSQVNLRLDERTEYLLTALQAKLNNGAAAIMRLAIARLAEQEGIQYPEPEGKVAA